MKTNILKGLTLIGKIAGIAGFAGGFLTPEKAALVFSVSSVLKDVVNRIGDQLDDGQSNGSFKPN